MFLRYLLCLSSILLVVACGQKGQRNNVVLPVRVEVMQVETGTSSSARLYSGTISEEEGVELSFTQGGTITEVNAKEGDFVRKGQCIAVIDSTVAAAQLRIAAAQLAQARDNYARMKGMHDSGSLPEMQWVEAQNQLSAAEAQKRMALKALEDTRLSAPFGGYVSGCGIRVGQNIAAGMPVAKVLRIDRVKAKFTVPESEVSFFQKGGQVTVLVPSAGHRCFPGRISSAGMEADRLTHSFEMTAILENPSRVVLPGMSCQVSASSQEESRIVIPSQAVALDSDNSCSVWLVQDGRATRKKVEVGGEDRSGICITEGLSEGDSLIVKGQQKVSEGSIVEVL